MTAILMVAVMTTAKALLGKAHGAVLGTAKAVAASTKFTYECPLVDALVRAWNHITGDDSNFHLEWTLDRTQGIGKTMWKLVKSKLEAPGGPLEQHWGKGPNAPVLILCLVGALLLAGCGAFAPAPPAPMPTPENVATDLSKQLTAEADATRENTTKIRALLVGLPAAVAAQISAELDKIDKANDATRVIAARLVNEVAAQISEMKKQQADERAAWAKEKKDMETKHAADMKLVTDKLTELTKKVDDLTSARWQRLGLQALVVLSVIGVGLGIRTGSVSTAVMSGAIGVGSIAYLTYGALIAKIGLIAGGLAAVGGVVWIILSLRKKATAANAEADSLSDGIQEGMKKLTPAAAADFGATLAKAQDERGTRAPIRKRRLALGHVAK